MRISLTPRAALVALLALPLVVIWPTWWMLLTCFVLWALVVLTDALLAPNPAMITVRRDAPGQVRLGKEATGRLLLTNPTARPARLEVRDAWNPTAGLAEQRSRLHVPPHERRAIRQRFLPTRRGEHSSRALLVASVGRLGLARRTARAQAPGRLLALHPFGSRRHLPSQVRRLREIEGLAATHQRGQGNEFDSLRDFVDGDDVRSTDWRASARRRSVVVRTWRPERDRHVLLVVEPPRTAAVHLALVETDWQLAASTLTSRARKGSLVVLVTPVEESVVHTGLLPVAARLARDHPLIVASVSDPALEELAAGRDDLGTVYRAAAAEQARTRRAGVAHALERTGAHVMDAPPEKAPQGLA